MKMKVFCRAIALSVMLITVLSGIAGAQKIDRTAYYAAMQSGSKDDIETELAKLTKDSEQGYAGALIIRKAGLPKAKERLKTFKEGKAKLEAGIAADPDNAELHFLRLSIQEKAPKIVGYKKDMEADKAYVIKHFDQLSPVVQRAVKDYSKESKILKPTDL